MRSIAVAILLSAGIIALIALDQMNASPLWVAPLSVAIGVGAACAATGGITWLSVIFGALGALAFGWMSAWNAPVGLVVMSAAWLAPRAFLTNSRRDLMLFGACAIPGAIVAGLTSAYFANGSFVQHLASCVFAGAALALSHVIVRVDAPVAHALRTAGRALDGAVGKALIEAADANRTAAELPGDESTPESKWRALLKDADTRVALHSTVGKNAEKKRAELDTRILEAAASLCLAAGGTADAKGEGAISEKPAEPEVAGGKPSESASDQKPVAAADSASTHSAA